MALLKFRCKECGKLFEELTDAKGMDKLRCPECGGNIARAYEGAVYRPGAPGCSGHCGSCSGCSCHK